MAYVYDYMQTKQHKQGAIAEDFVFNLLIDEGLKVYRQKLSPDKFVLPPKIKALIADDVVDFLERYPVDFFLVENGKLHVVEVKSKVVKFNKDDRKLDTSQGQHDFFLGCEQLGLNVGIIVIWLHGKKYYTHKFDLKELKLIGKTKLKLKVPTSFYYSPDRVKYKKII